MSEEFVIENGVLKGYDGPGGDIVIPEGVTEIGRQAFYRGMKPHVKLGTVTIPESVKHIREGAFEYSSLRRVVLPESLEEMGRDEAVVSLGVFSHCTNLESVTVPESIHYLRRCTFKYCTSLKSITLPKGLKSIGSDSLSDCWMLTHIELPEGLEVIGGAAFEGDKALEELTIPKSVKIIDFWAFKKCSSLTRMEIPEGITELKSDLFAGCTSLKEVVIPPSVQDTGNSVFQNCTSLPAVELPEGIPAIQHYMFKGCTALKGFRIPETVTAIKNHAFKDCASLREITIPAGVTVIMEEAFMNCASLERVVILGKDVKISAKAFENTEAEIIVDRLSLGKLPKNVRLYTLFRFAQRYLWGEDIPDGHRKQCLKYMKRMGVKLFPFACEHPVVLEVLLRERYIPVEAVPGLIEQAEEETVIAALEAYQTRN